jgi:peroxiredoxin Q/BCP
VRIGDLAPEFELPDNTGQTWRLSDHRGKVTALIFYPKDETPVCTKQMCSLRDYWSKYQATGAEVVAISTASVESHKRFVERHNLPQRLLADERGKVTRQYNVMSLLGVPQRAVIIIDAEGIVRYRKSVFPFFRPSDDEVLEAILSAMKPADGRS